MADEPPVRHRVLETVREYPGIHVRGIERHLRIPLALAQYHLKELEDARTIRSLQVGGFRRYFPAETFENLTPRERAVLNVLRRERPLEIVLTLLEAGRLRHQDILDAVGGTKPALTYHLEKLVDAGIVDRVARGDDRGFALKDPDGIRRLLRRYEPVDDVAARVHDTWDDLFSGHRRSRQAPRE